jgi:hypothetical protein
MAIERQSPRKIAERILSIQMEPNNDAIVLDVSDGGLGFRALNPVTRTGTIYFSFSENGKRIESRAELVWTDPTKKYGGLSFASLPRSNRERIRNWVDQGGTPEPTQPHLEPASSAPKQPVVPAASSQRANVATASFPAPAMSLPQPEVPGFALFEDDAQRAQAMWYPKMSVPGSGAKFFGGFLMGAIASAALIICFLLLEYRSQTNRLLNQWRGTIGASPVQLSPPAVPPPAATSSALASPEPLPSAGPNSPPLPHPLAAAPDVSTTTGATAKPQTDSPSAASRVAPAPETAPAKAAIPGEQDLALAQPYLRNQSGPGGSAVAARLLWAAVEKGNIQAEITLAQLYSRGDGVTKSCDQARVLLRAAAEKGSSEASQELSQLLRSGC